MGADCKSVGLRLRRFESCTCHPCAIEAFRVLTTRSSHPELSRFVTTRAKFRAAVLNASGCECT